MAASFGSCTSAMFLSQYPAGGTPTTLYQFDTSSNPFTYDVLGTSSTSYLGSGYNAIAFNPADNYLYSIVWNGTQFQLLRISSDGSVQLAGLVAGGGINTQAGTIVVGEIGADGYYYVHFQGTNRAFRIDLTTGTSTLITLSKSVNPSDWAWYNGYLWGVDSNNWNLIRVSPSTGQVTTIGPTGVSNPVAFGGMMGATNGIFGAENGGGFYRFDPLTGAATLISGSPSAAGNDGAKCVNTPLLFPADLAVTKTDASETYTPGGTVTYTIVVRNDGPFGAMNALVNDPLPAGITTASWTCGNPTNGAVCGEASGSGAIVDQKADLPAGATLTYTATMTVPADFNGELVNTAQISSPSDVPDPDSGNNTATDTDDITSITLVKTVTNDSSGGTSQVSDFTLAASGPTPVSGVSGSASVTNVPVEAGTYTLSETGPAGYTAIYDCTINGQAPVVGNTLTLAVGDDAACTITNDDIPPTVTMAKSLLSESGSLAGVAEPGETLTYQITLSNTGGQASNFGVTDAFDANTTFVSAD
ncbi:DUF11 domain-containing protein, partial [Ciceribacter sp. RN22]|uniref:DUF11 domain-containing protein n=1 Tax=Ciceribacter sp. RN22 TaxID=2954932 RepID=UPI00209263B5